MKTRLLRHSLSALLLLAISTIAIAQTTREEVLATPEKAGGVYYAYPVPPEGLPTTAAPAGYQPFYAAHFGRHGSRYLISARDYSRMLQLMERGDSAGVLTPLGRDVLRRLRLVWQEAEGHDGDLSPLGVRQHKAIAKRMMRNYPGIFTPTARVTARSTTVVRCVLSMAAFCESLKEEIPAMQITQEATNKYMPYLNFHSKRSQEYTSDEGPWRPDYLAWEKEHVRGERLIKSLFTDPKFVYKYRSAKGVAWSFYWIAVDIQDMEIKGVDFFDLFTPDELWDIWQTFNYSFYVKDGSYPGNGGLLVANASKPLSDIVERADRAIADGINGADLRFAHDGNLIPLAALMQIEGCYGSQLDPKLFYTAFADFKVAPMAGNIQIILFRKPGDAAAPVLAKVLHNEKEVAIPAVKPLAAPFYRWSDLRSFFLSQIEKSKPLL